MQLSFVHLVAHAIKEAGRWNMIGTSISVAKVFDSRFPNSSGGNSELPLHCAQIFSVAVNFVNLVRNLARDFVCAWRQSAVSGVLFPAQGSIFNNAGIS